MITAEKALQRLKEGNQRFIQNVRQMDAQATQTRRDELVFDLSFGDLFVVRVAGNIVEQSQIGSIEFAAERFGTPLVVVLGHSSCGAVAATIDALENPSTKGSPNVQSLVERIKPAVSTLVNTNLKDDKEALLAEAIRVNARQSAHQLRQGSTLLEQLLKNKKLKIVSAEYSLETGKVEFLDSE